MKSDLGGTLVRNLREAARAPLENTACHATLRVSMEWLLTTVRQYISMQALIGLTVLSGVFFVGSLVAIPFLLVRYAQATAMAGKPPSRAPTRRANPEKYAGGDIPVRWLLDVVSPRTGRSDDADRDLDARFSGETKSGSQNHQPTGCAPRDQSFTCKVWNNAPSPRADSSQALAHLIRQGSSRPRLARFLLRRV